MSLLYSSILKKKNMLGNVIKNDQGTGHLTLGSRIYFPDYMFWTKPISKSFFCSQIVSKICRSNIAGSNLSYFCLFQDNFFYNVWRHENKNT